jgi:hypothetical protein
MAYYTCEHNNYLVVFFERKCPVCEEQEENNNEIANLKDKLAEEEYMRENAEEELSRIKTTYDFVMKMEDAIK